MDTNGPKKAKRERGEIRVNVRLDAGLLRRLEKVAKAAGISNSDVVRMALNRELPAIGKAA